MSARDIDTERVEDGQVVVASEPYYAGRMPLCLSLITAAAAAAPSSQQPQVQLLLSVE
jgi:hypothetical protein